VFYSAVVIKAVGRIVCDALDLHLVDGNVPEGFL